MSISIVIQKSGTTEERRGKAIQNDLIVTEAQAVVVGIQSLFSFYHTRKKRDVSGIPYIGVKDGEVALIAVMSISESNIIHRVTGTKISIDLQSGIREVVSLEGDYVNPET